MATGRQDVDFEGVEPLDLSFKIDGVTITYDATKDRGSAAVDLACKLSAARTVALVVDGDPIIGQVIKVEPDGFATVRVEGGVTLPGGNAAALTAGKRIVGAVGPAAEKGRIRNAADVGGAYAQAAATDQQNGRGTIIDASVATAVQVLLGI
jgi:hypothetical protein